MEKATKWKDMAMESLTTIWKEIAEVFPNIIGTILLLIFGWLLTKLIVKVVKKGLKLAHANKLDDTLNESTANVEPADVVRFLMSIYEAKRFQVSNKQNSNYILSFDVPSFDIFLLDQFTKMRFDRRLQRNAGADRKRRGFAHHRRINRRHAGVGGDRAVQRRPLLPVGGDDSANPRLVQRSLRRRTNAPDQPHRFFVQEISGFCLANHREPARLVEVGCNFGQELIM